MLRFQYITNICICSNHSQYVLMLKVEVNNRSECQKSFIIRHNIAELAQTCEQVRKIGQKEISMVPSFSFQGSSPKSVSMGRTPLYFEQEDVINVLIETLPLQLRRSNGRASASNGKRKPHRTSGLGLVHDSFFLLFCASHNALVCEWKLDNVRVLVHARLCASDLITNTSWFMELRHFALLQPRI